jgi:hypothetical protein
MIADSAFANLEVLWISESGDTGKREAEHRSFLLMFTHQIARNGLSRPADFNSESISNGGVLDGAPGEI